MGHTPLPFYEHPVIPQNSTAVIVETKRIDWLKRDYILGYRMSEDEGDIYIPIIFYHEDDNATYYEQFKGTVCFDLPKWVYI